MESPLRPGHLSRRRLLAGGGLLAAASAIGAVGYAAGRSASEPQMADSVAAKVHQFVTRPDLEAPVVTITASGPRAEGFLFLTPAAGAGGRGPLVVDDTGAPVWFRQLSGPDTVAINAQVQRYRGQPVITWWEGTVDRSNGVGAGEFVIIDTAYREVARVRTPNRGVPADQHDFVLTDEGTALFFAYEPAATDLSAVGGPVDGALYDNVLYEVDIESGRAIWTWRASDHVALHESYATVPSGEGRHAPYDFFHANSVGLDTDADLLVSARHTWAIYKLDRRSGGIRWRLGGKRSDFALTDGASFSWQHDARRRSDGTLGLFDNGAGDTTEADQSRGLILALDETTRRARVVRELRYPKPLLARTQGGLQELPGGASLVGYGELPYLSEHAADGTVRMTGELPADNVSYRAFRLAWSGQPDDRPAVAAVPSGSAAVVVHASWNGATDVARWRVHAGQQPDTLRMVTEVRRQGFETSMVVERPVAFVAVDAVDGSGRTLGSSRVLPVPSPTTGP